MAQTKDIAENDRPEIKDSFKVPQDLRKAKVTQVMSLLEREYVTKYPQAPNGVRWI